MTPKYIVIHTSAMENASFEAVKKYHIEERGWDDIGYHFYIEKNGRIKRGRDENIVGSHCRAASMNFKSLGICFEGHHDYEEWTQDQETSFDYLCLKLMDKYNIPKENIIGHREAYDMEGIKRKKTCPGKKINMSLVREKYGSKIKEIPTAELEELDEGKIDFKQDKIDRL